MFFHQAELDNSLLFYMAATVLYGGTIFYRAKKNRVEKATPFRWGLLLLLTLEVLCFTTLRSSLGLTLFSLACLMFFFYTPAQAMLPVNRKAVFITGTDSGIGHELAKYLDSLGFTVFVSVLDAAGPGAKKLKETCSERLSILQLDITSSAQIKEAYLEIRQKLQNEELWAVINNAGILGFLADGELLPMSSYKQCMDVNFFGPVELSKMFLPLLRKSKGRIINISSLAGGIPMPLFAAYGASKAALSMFSGVMRQELSKWGIKVAVFHPSGFKTSIGGNPEDWKKEEQMLLESLAPDVKKDYGEDYIHKLRIFLGQMTSICSSDFSPVFSDVLHALLAEHPRGLYTPETQQNSKISVALADDPMFRISESYEDLWSKIYVPHLIQEASEVVKVQFGRSFLDEKRNTSKEKHLWDIPPLSYQWEGLSHQFEKFILS